MVRERYESPKMTFEEVKVDEAVANECWGHHADGNTIYADANGSKKGYYSFAIKSGNCHLNLINVIYYESKGSTGESITDPKSAKYTDLYDYLAKGGGSDGNPFKDGTIYVTNNPNDPLLS